MADVSRRVGQCWSEVDRAVGGAQACGGMAPPKWEPGQLILAGTGEMQVLGGEDKSFPKDRLFSPQSTRLAVQALWIWKTGRRRWAVILKGA